MSFYHIAGTAVQADILQPDTTTGFVSLFYGAGETANGNMLSVNAGTSNLGYVFAVGLGGINGAFANSLSNAGQDANLYQTIHQQLYDTAGKGLTAFSSNYEANDPVQFSLLQKPDPSFNLPSYDGIVFIDIFNAAQLPNANPLNYGMVYLVPPNSSNYESTADFLQAVQASSLTIVAAMQTFNKLYAGAGNAYNLQQADTLRMCLFSGGIYAGDTPKSDVAEYNVKGLQTGLSGKSNSITLVEFEFDEAKHWLAENPTS